MLCDLEGQLSLVGKKDRKTTRWRIKVHRRGRRVKREGVNQQVSTELGGWGRKD